MRSLVFAAALIGALTCFSGASPLPDRAALASIINGTLQGSTSPREHSLSGKYPATPLDTYVTKKDPAFHWNLAPTWSKKGDGWSAVLLNVTSQSWLNSSAWSYSDGAPGGKWWHHVLVVVPDKLVVTDTAFVWIGEDDNAPSQHPDDGGLDLTVATTVATRIGAVAAACYFIPNQPVKFSSETPVPRSREEDEVIAWGWHEFISKGQSTDWILRLPMTKGVFAAMDAVEAYTASEDYRTRFAAPLAHAATLRSNSGAESESKATDPDPVSRWIVSGASKRGWTTWTVAAVDQALSSPRVIGMIPVVMDLLQMQRSLHHDYRSQGGWSFAFKPYYEAPVNLTELLDSEGVARLAAVSDPYVYIDRYANLPKLVMNALGDEFFSLDNDMFWFDDLPGEKFRLMLPNAEHSLATAEQQAIDGAAAFSLAVVHDLPRPSPSWQFSGPRPEGAPVPPGGFPSYGTGAASGDLTFRCQGEGAQGGARPGAQVEAASPTNVTAWFAYSASGTGRRDFRLAAGYPKTEPQLVLWLPYDLTGSPSGPCEWKAQAPEEQKGQWGGLIIDTRFPLQSGCGKAGQGVRGAATRPANEGGAAALDTSCLAPGAAMVLRRAVEAGLEFDITSTVSITPATYPFPDCKGSTCKGKLL